MNMVSTRTSRYPYKDMRRSSKQPAVKPMPSIEVSESRRREPSTTVAPDLDGSTLVEDEDESEDSTGDDVLDMLDVLSNGVHNGKKITNGVCNSLLLDQAHRPRSEQRVLATLVSFTVSPSAIPGLPADIARFPTDKRS